MKKQKSLVKEAPMVLPNPLGMYDTEAETYIQREQCVKQCIGCARRFVNDETAGDAVCVPYLFPKSKWKRHSSEEGEKTIDRRKVPWTFHYNPCPMATHATHTVIDKSDTKVRVGQQRHA